MDQNMSAVKNQYAPFVLTNGFARKTTSEKETVASWGPVKIYIHRFKEPCKFFISSLSL